MAEVSIKKGVTTIAKLAIIIVIARRKKTSQLKLKFKSPKNQAFIMPIVRRPAGRPVRLFMRASPDTQSTWTEMVTAKRVSEECYDAGEKLF